MSQFRYALRCSRIVYNRVLGVSIVMGNLLKQKAFFGLLVFFSLSVGTKVAQGSCKAVFEGSRTPESVASVLFKPLRHLADEVATQVHDLRQSGASDPRSTELAQSVQNLKILYFYQALILEAKKQGVHFLENFMRSVQKQGPEVYQARRYMGMEAAVLMDELLASEGRVEANLNQAIERLTPEVRRLTQSLSWFRGHDIFRAVRKDEGQLQVADAMEDARIDASVFWVQADESVARFMSAPVSEFRRVEDFREAVLKTSSLVEIAREDMLGGGERAAFWEGLLVTGKRALLAGLKPTQDPHKFLEDFLKKRMHLVTSEEFARYGEIVLGEKTGSLEGPKPYLERVEEKRAKDREAEKQKKKNQNQPDPLSNYGIALEPFTSGTRKSSKIKFARETIVQTREVSRLFQVRELLEPLVDKINASPRVREVLGRLGESERWAGEYFPNGKSVREIYFESLNRIESIEDRLKQAQLTQEEITEYRKNVRRASQEKENLKAAFVSVEPRIYEFSPQRREVKRTILSDLREGKKAALFWIDLFQVDAELLEEGELVEIFVMESLFVQTNGRRRFQVTLEQWEAYEKAKESEFSEIAEEQTAYYRAEEQRKVQREAEAKREIIYFERAGSSQPREFLAELNIAEANHAKLVRRKIRSLETGQVKGKPLAEYKIFELKVDAGPGYRIYFQRNSLGDYVILRIGKKGTQARDKLICVGSWRYYQENES